MITDTPKSVTSMLSSRRATPISTGAPSHRLGHIARQRASPAGEQPARPLLGTVEFWAVTGSGR